MRKIWPLFFLLSSCYKDHLYVQQEWIDQQSLASSHIGSPDPRRKEPYIGQKLLIGWEFSLSLYEEDLTLFVTVRLYDNSQHTYCHHVDQKRGWTSYFFPNPLEEKEKRILTYRVEVQNREGKVVESWLHQLWTEKVDVEESLFKS